MNKNENENENKELKSNGNNNKNKIEKYENPKSNGRKELISNGNTIDLSLSEIPQNSQYLLTDVDLTLNNIEVKDNAFARRKFINDLKYLADENSFLPMNKNYIKNNYYPKNHLFNYEISKNKYPLNILNLNANDAVYPQNKFSLKNKK